MFNPIFALIVYFVFSYLIGRSKNEKDTVEGQKPSQSQKHGGFFSEMLKDIEQALDSDFQEDKEPERKQTVFTMMRDLEKNINSKIDQQPRQTEIQSVIKPERREGVTSQTRLERIEDQRDKVREHSELERSQRMQKQQMMRATRLSEQLVPLAIKDPKHRMENYDLDQKRRVSIQTSEALKSSLQSKSSRDIDIKRDIKKAIIYSETLGKPKSLQK